MRLELLPLRNALDRGTSAQAGGANRTAAGGSAAIRGDGRTAEHGGAPAQLGSRRFRRDRRSRTRMDDIGQAASGHPTMCWPSRTRPCPFLSMHARCFARTRASSWRAESASCRSCDAPRSYASSASATATRARPVWMPRLCPPPGRPRWPAGPRDSRLVPRRCICDRPPSTRRAYCPPRAWPSAPRLGPAGSRSTATSP